MDLKVKGYYLLITTYYFLLPDYYSTTPVQQHYTTINDRYTCIDLQPTISASYCSTIIQIPLCVNDWGGGVGWGCSPKHMTIPAADFGTHPPAHTHMHMFRSSIDDRYVSNR